MSQLESIQTPVKEELKQFADIFETALSHENPLLGMALEHLKKRTGKRMRPVLVLLCARLTGRVNDAVLNAAAALELLHTASLVHDDVVDESDTRRGQLSVNALSGNKVAVLVGDYILTRVIHILAELRNTTILNIVSNMGASLTSGELLQLHSGQSMWISEEQYNKVIEQKTACLFAACSEAGAARTGATMRQMTAMKQFGLHLGMCFQLKDDVLDYSDIEDIGKPTMNDIRDGKATLPLLISLQRAPKEEAEHIREIAEALALKSPHIDSFEAEQEIKSFVLRYEGIRYAHQEMEKHRKKALAALSIFPDNKYKECLVTLLGYAISRVK